MPKARRVPRATKSVQCVRNARICKGTQTARDFPVDNFTSTVFALSAFLQGEKKAAEVRQRQCEIFLASLTPLLHSGDDSSVRKCLYGMSQNCEKDQGIMQDLLNVLRVMPAEHIVVKPDISDREEGIVELSRQRGGFKIQNKSLAIIDRDGRLGQVHKLPNKYKIFGMKKRNEEGRTVAVKFKEQAKVISTAVAPVKSANAQATAMGTNTMDLDDLLSGSGKGSRTQSCAEVAPLSLESPSASPSAQGSSGGDQNYIPNSQLSQFYGSQS